LLPRERNKTVTGLVGAPVGTKVSDPDVQRLDSFVAESIWQVEAINGRRLDLELGTAETASPKRGALIIDDSGDRKWGTKMAFTSRQYLVGSGRSITAL
jgi:SRSO17 transposase